MNEGNIHVLARAVIIDEGHILLAYDPRTPSDHYYYWLNTSFYYLPGGHIEFQESAQDALIREIEEETGHKGSIERFLGIQENAWAFNGDERYCHSHEINLIFKVNVPESSFKRAVQQREDHVAFKWIPVNEFHSITLMPEALKTLLPKWLKVNMNEAFGSLEKK